MGGLSAGNAGETPPEQTQRCCVDPTMRPIVVFSFAFVLVGCAPIAQTDGPAGTGGASGGSSGTPAKGGSGGAAPGSGGMGTGGTTSTGGSPGTGGIASTDGSTGTGGIASTGGSTGTGGIASTGGSTGTGGVVASGVGTAGTAGTAGSGGTAGSNGTAGIGGKAGGGGKAGNGGMAGSGGKAGSGGASCAQGAKQCNGLQPQMCDMNGVWQNNGAACGECNTCSMSTGACAPMDGATCDDHNACTQNDKCMGGQCMGSAILCNSPPACKLSTTCSAGSCNYSQPVQEGTMDPKCDSGTPYCSSGQCVRCTADTQCSGATPSCDSQKHTCVCRVPSKGNLLANPGFDGMDLHDWTVQTGTVTASQDSEQCPASSSAYVANAEDNPLQCFSITGGSYFLGGKFTNGQVGNFIRLVFWPESQNKDGSCPNSADGTTFDWPLDMVAGSSDWTSAFTQVTVPSGTKSARITFLGQNQYMDQLYVNTANHF
jgi:hypothetical protein